MIHQPVSIHFLPVTAHRLFYATFILMLGIIFQAYWQSITVIIGLNCLFVGIAIFKKNFLFFLFALAFSSGSFLYQRQINNHISFYQQFGDTTYDLLVTVNTIEKIEAKTTRYCILATIDQAKLSISKTEWQKISGTIQMYMNSLPRFNVADQIQLTAIILKKPSNPSFGDYLVKEGINTTIFLSNKDCTIIHRPHYSIIRRFFYYKQGLLNSFKTKLSSKTFGLFSSIFLGNRSFKKEWETPKELCKTWGISHFLARSGLHLIIFIFLWNFLLNLLPLPFFFKQSLFIVLVSIYVLLSWTSISFIRAFVSFLLYKLCIIIKTPPQFLHLLTITTCCVLLYNPIQLFFLDFQLSFGLTYALAWFNLINTQKK